MIQLRHSNDVIVYGSYEEFYPSDKNLYVYTRTLDKDLLFVALNFTSENQNLEVPSSLDLSGAKLLISNYENNDNIPNKLRPYEAIVYLKK